MFPPVSDEKDDKSGGDQKDGGELRGGEKLHQCRAAVVRPKKFGEKTPDAVAAQVQGKSASGVFFGVTPQECAQSEEKQGFEQLYGDYADAEIHMVQSPFRRTSVAAACHEAAETSESVGGGDTDGEQICDERERRTVQTVRKIKMSGGEIDGEKQKDTTKKTAEESRAGVGVQAERAVRKKVVACLHENCRKIAADDGQYRVGEDKIVQPDG